MNLRATDIQEVARASELWQEVVDASEDGWLWHTWRTHEFNLSAGETYKAKDLSFFVYEGERAVGVVPLIIQEKKAEDGVEREATYYSGFLPWPCFRSDVQNKEELEDFAFAELERRVRKAGARCIKVRLTPPQNAGDEEVRVGRIAEAHAFTPHHFDSHVAAVTSDTLTEVRERYRRYHRKYAPFFTLNVLEGVAVTLELEETYFRLHVKDSGGQFRSRESYAKQTDIARRGEAFYVVATHTESGAVVGMLLVSVYKNAAYDNSVAVDPDFADRYVSHLLKWRAIEELQKKRIPTYELGPKADPASATQKELGITHFKEGWSRGHTRTVWEMEKLLEL